MDLIIGVIVAFFLGGVSGWVLRATREDATPETSDEVSRGGSPSGPRGVPGEREASPELGGPGDRLGEVWTGDFGGTPEPAAAAYPEGDHHAGAPRQRGPVTVLLADDRMELVSLHRAHLELHGYRVITATDGNAALALARAEHPSVVVLDHSMPGRSGIDVTRALKADPATADIVVLLMTAHSYGAIGATARAAGASGFMSKPCEPSRVLREVAVYAAPRN